MCTDARFKSDIEKGKFGEDIVMKWLDSYKTDYDNVTEDKAYQDIDVDFVVHASWWKKSKADSFVFVIPVEDDYMLVKLKKSFIQEWIDLYKPREMSMGNGKGYYIKLNELNKYQKNNKTIIEYVEETYPKERILYYVKQDGSLCKSA